MTERTRGGRAVMAAGLASQVSVATVGGLPWVVLPVSMAAYAAACEVSDRATGRRSEVLRWSGTALALLGLLLLAPRIVSNGDRTEVKQVLGLMLITAQVGQAMSWRGPRDVRSALVASSGLLVLSASYAPDVLVGVPLLVGWTAVLLALALLGGMGTQEAARAATLAVVLGLVGFLLIPVPPTQGARSRLAALAAGNGTERLPTDAFATTSLDLRKRGTLGKSPVLRVPADSPPLWRATSFDSYDGTAWHRNGEQLRLPGNGPTYQVSSATGPIRIDTAERVGYGRSSGTVWSPGPIVSVTATDAFVPLLDDQGDVQLSGTATYDVASLAPVTDAARLRSGRGADLADPRWTALPELPARVRQLARQLERGSRYDTAAAIESYLRDHASYRLDSPVPLAGQDAVDRFLFVDRSGFCEQFASAEVVLLRALGIPSRLVTGLGYGVREGDHRLFRVSDLHAWAEVWVPGAGWVSSDPTPPSTEAAGGGQTIRRRLANTLSGLLGQLTRVPGGRPALAVLVLVTGLVVSTLLGRRPVRRQRASVQLRAGPALAAFLRLDARLGAGRRRDTESLRELARRLDPSLAQALGVVERECYGSRSPEPAEVRAAVAVLDRASAPGPEGPRARRARPGARGRTRRRG